MSDRTKRKHGLVLRCTGKREHIVVRAIHADDDRPDDGIVVSYSRHTDEGRSVGATTQARGPLTVSCSCAPEGWRVDLAKVAAAVPASGYTKALVLDFLC